MSDVYDGPWRLMPELSDIATGRTVWAFHHGDGRITFRTDYPVDAIMDANHEASAAAQGTRFGDFARIASVPLNVYHDSGLAEAHRQDDGKFLSKFLNDGDNRAWRTRGGRV